jgi:hypothetical protein
MQTNLPPGTTLTAKLTRSEGGHPAPTLDVVFPRATHHRAASAAMHRLAAVLEEATPAEEKWLVVISTVNEGRITLELDQATDTEAARGLALLRWFAR